MTQLKNDDYCVYLTVNDREMPFFMKGKHSYVAVPNGSFYKLVLRSNSDVASEAHIFTDGKERGRARLNGHDTFIIDGPLKGVDGEGSLFYFCRESEAVTKQSGITVNDDANGLMEILFQRADDPPHT